MILTVGAICLSGLEVLQLQSAAEVCGETDPLVLEFHYINGKVEPVQSPLLSLSPPNYDFRKGMV